MIAERPSSLAPVKMLAIHSPICTPNRFTMVRNIIRNTAKGVTHPLSRPIPPRYSRCSEQTTARAAILPEVLTNRINQPYRNPIPSP
jgi:hypothetical protein